jgi:hypothetical protein
VPFLGAFCCANGTSFECAIVSAVISAVVCTERIANDGPDCSPFVKPYIGTKLNTNSHSVVTAVGAAIGNAYCRPHIATKWPAFRSANWTALGTALVAAVG